MSDTLPDGNVTKNFFWKKIEHKDGVTYVFWTRILLYVLAIAYLAGYFSGVLTGIAREAGLTVVLAYALISFMAHSKPFAAIREAYEEDPERIVKSGNRFSFTNPMTITILNAAPAPSGSDGDGE